MIITGQVAVGTASSLLCTLPAGPFQAVIANAGTVTAWVAAGTAPASAGNGFPVPSTGVPVTITGYPGGNGSQLQAYAAAGTATIAVAYILSSASGGTGP